MHLYRPVVVKGQSFAGVKKHVIPSQSMTLREIIKRFLRKESLPIEKEGFYEERFGDLEKISKEDVVVQHERAADLKEKIEKAARRMKVKEDLKKHEEEIERSKRAAETKSGETGEAGTVEKKV